MHSLNLEMRFLTHKQEPKSLKGFVIWTWWLRNGLLKDPGNSQVTKNYWGRYSGDLFAHIHSLFNCGRQFARTSPKSVERWMQTAVHGE